MTDDGLTRFMEELDERVQDLVTAEPELMTRDAFVRHAGKYLVDDGTLDDIEPCYLHMPWQNRRIEIAGYDVTADGTKLHLVAADYGAFLSTVRSDRVDQMIRRAGAFAEFCRAGEYSQLEPSSAAFDMTERIHSVWSDLRTIRIFILTDGSAQPRNLPDSTVAGLPTSVDVWDATRLYRLATSGELQEEIRIDLTQRGYTVGCLRAPKQADGYDCLLATLPGQLLAELYEEHHSRLLQRNVRAFLQARGKVNKGIADTIRAQPERFLAYNNGISAVARDAELQRAPTGDLVLNGLSELQIVNGGQTTASLHRAWRQGLSLDDIHVPAKITLLEDDQLDTVVPDIARYANSQNAVTAADFEGNSPFHVRLQEFSRSVWAPAVDGNVRQTHWYYERVRGQYEVDRGKRHTRALQRRFEQDNPRSQRFGKTDAAKYELTYSLNPHLVSQGGEKCFRHWTIEENLAERGAPPVEYFRHLVAKAILFNSARKLIQREKFGGYLGQTTTHTLALIAERLGGVDLDLIWRLQGLPDTLVQEIPEVARVVRTVLVDPPGSANVTEWCKKEDCWKAVQQVTWNPSAALRAEVAGHSVSS